MLGFHEPPIPGTCEVCSFAIEHGLDPRYEHALTRLATLWLLQDLDDLAGQPARLSALAVRSAGVEPGPVHELDPRHWYWAMFYEPEIRISLAGEEPQ